MAFDDVLVKIAARLTSFTPVKEPRQKFTHNTSSIEGASKVNARTFIFVPPFRTKQINDTSQKSFESVFWLKLFYPEKTQSFESMKDVASDQSELYDRLSYTSYSNTGSDMWGASEIGSVVIGDMEIRKEGAYYTLLIELVVQFAESYS
jgi:hypothetical protein